MPTHDQIARKMAQFGRREAKAMGALERVQNQRCAYLQSLMSDANLSDDVTALGVAPKDRNP
jgi:hypothetical protein